MKSFRELISSFIQVFVVVFVLIELALDFLFKKDFFYAFVRNQLVNFSNQSFIDNRFFPDVIAVIVSIPITIVLMLIVSLGENHLHEEYSKASLEKAKTIVNAKTIVMVGDKK